jgi:hypothetical protein
MKRTQILSSGLIVRQDIGEAIRAVFFQTDYEDFLYATHGGTLFIVSFRGREYGLTSRHVFQDFEPGKLFITAEKHGQKGSMPAPITGLYYPTSPSDGAVDTDIIDICVIEFADDIAPDFFKGSAYIIDDETVGTSKPGHELQVVGVLKDKSSIVLPDISMGFCRLQLHDAGRSTSDPVLRQATAKFRDPSFDRITGISGSPVFDQSASTLCGMVVRGVMNGDECIIHFVDIFDIVRLLEGISTGAASTYYVKRL